MLEASISKDEYKWHIVKEMRKNPVLGVMIEHTMITRQDGFTVESIGIGRFLEETFLAKGNFGEFKFVASRMEQRDPIGSEQSIEAGGGYPYVLSNKYIVRAIESSIFEITKNDVLLCKKYSRDIESALLNFPMEGRKIYNNTPVIYVLFNIGEATKPHYVQAKDL